MLQKEKTILAATRLDRVTSGLWAPRATSCAMLLDGTESIKTSKYTAHFDHLTVT